MFGVLDITTANDADGSEGQLLCKFLSPLSVTPERLESASDTLSLKRRTSRGLAQRWRIETSGISGSQSVDYFINNMIKGATEVLFVRPPLMIKYGGTAVGLQDGTPSVEYPASAGGEIMFSKGTGSTNAPVTVGASTFAMTLNADSQVFKGDFIKFNGHDKVYLITNIDSINIGANTANISTLPALTAPVGGSEVIHLGKNVAMSCYQEVGSVLGLRYLDGILEDLSNLQFVEAL